MARQKLPIKQQSKHHLKGVVLEHVSKGFSISKACKAAGIHRNTVDHWRKVDPQFAEDIAAAYEAGTDLIEDELRRRAVDGFEQPIFYKGEEVGRVRLYSDQLLIELMRARRPHKYRSTWNGPYSNEPPEEVREIKRLIIDAEYSEVKDAPAKPEPVPLVPKGS